MKCRVCKTRLDPILEDDGSHPYCEPILPTRIRSEQLEMPFTAVHPGEDPLARRIKDEVIKVIHWRDRRNPRSAQVNIGPSELSSPCDRRIGYRLAQIERVNTALDPWPAIVGTAVHDWLESAFRDWIADTVTPGQLVEWVPETRLEMAADVQGRSDLFWVPEGIVIDYKGASPDKMKTVKSEGSPENYRRQVQIYGYGYERAGFKVNHVSLFYFPRAGNIKDAHVDVWPYDRNVALMSLARIPAIARRLVELGIDTNPHRWEQVDAVPSRDCGFCPWYNFRRSPEEGASDQGCPGK